MKRFWKIAMCVLLAALAGGGFLTCRARQSKATPVRLAQVERVETLTSVVNASGEIRAHDVVDIQAEIPGVVVELPVKEGQTIAKGDLLLRIDPFQSRMELEGARARVAAAEAQQRQAEAAVAAAEGRMAALREQLKAAEAESSEAEIIRQRENESLKRQKGLLDSKTISIDAYEEAEARAQTASKRADAARARLEQSRSSLRVSQLSIEEQKALAASAAQEREVHQAALKRAEDQLDKVTILSPLSGTLIRLNVSVGERAVPGIQSNPQATLMTIADVSQIEAELEVDETDIVRVSMGDPATVKVDALPDQKLAGRVTEIGTAPIQNLSQSQSQQEGKDFKVVLTIDDPTTSLRVGMSCEADITVDTRSNAVVVPLQALTIREVDTDADGRYVAPPKPDNRAKAADAKPSAAPANGKNKKKEMPGVFVMGDDGYAHFRPVKTGIVGESKAEVLEGLAEGDAVIIGPLQSLRVLDEWTRVEKQTEPAP